MERQEEQEEAMRRRRILFCVACARRRIRIKGCTQRSTCFTELLPQLDNLVLLEANGEAAAADAEQVYTSGHWPRVSRTYTYKTKKRQQQQQQLYGSVTRGQAAGLPEVEDCT